MRSPAWGGDSGVQPVQGEAKQGASRTSDSPARETLETIRQKLPAAWHLSIEPEPVFKGNIFVVEAGVANAQTLVLVHGLGQNGFKDWLKLIPRLAENYHVLALDLPGFGLSSVPSGQYSPVNYAKVIESLVATRTHGPVVIVGHSMGGAVALRYASTYPDRVKQLVLIDAAGILERAAFVKDSARIPIAVENTPSFLKGITARFKDFGDFFVERLATHDSANFILQNTWIRGALDRQTNVNAAVALIEEDFSNAVHTTSQPTYIIWGEVDEIAPLRTGQLLARNLPNAELSVISGAGHNLIETHSDAVADRLLAVFQRPITLNTLRANEPEITADFVSFPDGKCQSQADVTFSGTYREIIIDDCYSVKLVNVRAGRIVVSNSVVDARNVVVQSGSTAISVTHSVLVVTGSEFRGELPIYADDSRLDLAGVRLRGKARAIQVDKRSQFIFSVSHSESDLYAGYVHGSYVAERQAFR